MTRLRSGAVVVTVASLTIAACGGGGEEATITTLATTTTTAVTTTTAPPTTTTSTLPAPTTTEAPAVVRQPLTGEPLDDASQIVDRPALAVKIDNHPDARRNHSGLAVADIVFEELVEGSATRFAAVLHSEDADPIGPIRSGRSQDVALLSPLNAPLFAWSGGNGGVTRLIAASFLTDLNWQTHATSYSRGPGPAPHNLYSSSERLYSLTPEDHPGPPPQQFQYLDPGDTFDGLPATEVAVTIGSNDVVWTWDADEDRYLRTQEGTPHVDATYGRIGAENVVVLVVDYQPSVIDRNSPEAQTLGEGQVFVFTDGQVVEGRWTRELEIYTFTFTDDRGETIRLSPGRTWVELSPTAPTFT